ncbi:Glutamyl-tRNA(Gln) amidotransferase subunit A protein [Fagus crenata]
MKTFNFKTHKASILFSLLIFLSSSLFPSQSLTPAATIDRTTKQLVLASLPASHETTPTSSSSSQLFLTSPSGEYAAYLLRRETSSGAGSDFCYIQVQEGSVSIWVSKCTSISNVNTCSLVFSDAGLEIFDGSQSSWNIKANGNHLKSLNLVDSGDMHIRDKDGKLVWKASDNPTINQNCGSQLGSHELLAPALPSPFATPISNKTPSSGQSLNSQEGQSELGYQQEQETGYPQQGLNQPLSGFNQPFSSPNQPLSGFNQPISSTNQPLSGFNQPFSSINQPFGTNNQQGLMGNTPLNNGVSGKNAFMQGVVLVCLITFGFIV